MKDPQTLFVYLTACRRNQQRVCIAGKGCRWMDASQDNPYGGMSFDQLVLCHYQKFGYPKIKC